MEFQQSNGWIEVICGNMYAGKTEELLRRVRRLEYAKKSVIVFKPKIDDRYSKDEVVSHNNVRTKSYAISGANEIMNYLNESLPDAIAIDEVQFFGHELIDIIEDLADKGVRVIAAGLDCNFRGEPFGIMPELLARAEYVDKLKAICQVCGAPASRTQRLIDGEPASYDDPEVLVGAKEQYEARCRHCHVVKRKRNNE